MCLVDKVRRIKVLSDVRKGNHGKLKEVNFFKCRKLHVKCNNGFVSLNIDGELSKVKEVLFEVVNRKIRVADIVDKGFDCYFESFHRQNRLYKGIQIGSNKLHRKYTH